MAHCRAHHCRAFWAALLLLGGIQGAWGDQLGGVKLGKFKTESSWILAPGINAGYNKLLTGYEGYENLGNLGLDLYIQPPRETPQRTSWYHNVLFRFSFDYFPLQVPKGNFGLTEDIYSLNFSFLY